jgi:predicted TIM-barrel fold metal-dependent hydrolase
MKVVDADAHVIETERTWDYMEPSERAYRPVVFAQSSPPDPARQAWLIDGRVRLRGNIGKDTPEESRELNDVAARLRHMDELGIDVQVLYPSLFTQPITLRPEVELAISRSYNRWIADMTAGHLDRLRWVMVPPVLSLDKALAELEWAKRHGACAVYMYPVQREKLLNDPYFDPLYERASDLDLPIVVHAATGNFAMHELFARENTFCQFKLPVVGAFHVVASSGLAQRFPRLRFGFVEVTAQWVPYALHDLARRACKRGREPQPDLLRQNRIWVACQTDDDLPYVLQYAGEDNLVIGTDYGHDDTASELEALRTLRAQGAVEPRVIDKILDANARALYGL